MSILSAENLSKRYKFRQVIKDISLEVRSGEVVGLLGPNGAGKTTAFYMIVGLIAADEGRMRRLTNRTLASAQQGYARLLRGLLRVHWLVIALFAAGLVYAVMAWQDARQEFLPRLDEGDVRIDGHVVNNIEPKSLTRTQPGRPLPMVRRQS